MLDPSAFQTTDPLVDYTIRIMNLKPDFIADQVFVPQPIPKKLFKKYQYDNSNKRIRQAKKSSKAKADVVDYGVFTTSAVAELRKLSGEIDPADERDFDGAVADITTDMALTLQEQLWLVREGEMITKLAPGNFATGLTLTLTGSSIWTQAGSDPVADVISMRTAIRTACGVAPNAMGVSWTGLQKLMQAPALVDRIKYTSGGPVTLQAMAALFGVQEINVCGGISTTSTEGAASQALSDQWANFALLYVKGVPGRRGMSFGNDFIVQQLYSRQYLDNERGAADPIKMLEMGWWYTLEAGAVDSAGSGKFLAGARIDGIF